MYRICTCDSRVKVERLNFLTNKPFYISYLYYIIIITYYA
ncbi:hypothetical protein VSDKYIMU_CDS0113 [Enterococcus phage VRE9_4]